MNEKTYRVYFDCWVDVEAKDEKDALERARSLGRVSGRLRYVLMLRVARGIDAEAIVTGTRKVK